MSFTLRTLTNPDLLLSVSSAYTLPPYICKTDLNEEKTISIFISAPLADQRSTGILLAVSGDRGGKMEAEKKNLAELCKGRAMFVHHGWLRTNHRGDGISTIPTQFSKCIRERTKHISRIVDEGSNYKANVGPV